MKFRNEYWFLSNFYPCKLTCENGFIYKTTEHLYQSYKTLDSKEKLLIRNAKTPGNAKRLGQKIIIRSNWESIKIQVMYRVLKIKFQDKDLLYRLLVIDQPIIETNPCHDNFWGDCECFRCRNIIGKNNLGKLLMKIQLENKK